MLNFIKLDKVLLLSAASSLVNGRHDTKTAAIFPLRGRTLNVSDKSVEQALENKEINAIFKLLNLGTSEGNVFESCKTLEEAEIVFQQYSNYGKVIISTDSDSDGAAIKSSLVYTFSKMGRFLIQLGKLYWIDSPFWEQDGKFYYNSDPVDPGTGFPIGINPHKSFKRFKGLGSLDKEDIHNAFYNPATRRLIKITEQNIDYGMSLVEDINQRKKLLIDEGIITNPFNLPE